MKSIEPGRPAAGKRRWMAWDPPADGLLRVEARPIIQAVRHRLARVPVRGASDGTNRALHHGMTGNTNIAHRFTINAEPSLAFLALTEQHHMAKWWSADSVVEKWIGGKLRLGAVPHQCALVVEKMESGETIEWRCVQDGDAPADECAGTKVRFQISRNEKGGTEVAFTHQGWKSQCACFKRWSATWSKLAGKSLKAYLETGLGTPVC